MQAHGRTHTHHQRPSTQGHAQQLQTLNSSSISSPKRSRTAGGLGTARPGAEGQGEYAQWVSTHSG